MILADKFPPRFIVFKGQTMIASPSGNKMISTDMHVRVRRVRA